MHIAICGGAGYIGSHMAKFLARHGQRVTVFDNLSTGHRPAVQWGELVVGDLLHRPELRRFFESRRFDAVMHFSARSLVGESMHNPALYYQNNVVGTINLLETMREFGVGQFVFSSSAATFGNPITPLIAENHPQFPINPYGETKLMVERILRDYAEAYGLNSVSLRYFNAAGADPEGAIGEAHDPETHLIPNILKTLVASGPELKVFGQDYETPDGTCVRDYIHVDDLCAAHLQALTYTAQHPGAHGFNLGNGRGFSVLEVIKAAEEVTGRKISYRLESPRVGDAPVLVADSRLAKRELGWQPAVVTIEEILVTAWRWHQNQKF